MSGYLRSPQTPGIDLTSGLFTANELSRLLELAAIVGVQGDVIYHNGADWVALAAGTNGNVLTTGGAGANPSWTGAGAGDMILASIQTVTGAKTFNDGKLILAGATSGTTVLKATAIAGTTTVTLPAATTTLVGTDTTDTLTNKTLTSPKLNENVAVTTTATKLNYLTSATGTTGTASTNIVFSTSPVLTTPTLGVASATSLATSAASPLLLTNGQLVTVALTSQTVGGTTLTIPDFASVVDEFTFKTKAQTMSNKTFVAPALGAATATSINGLTITSSTGVLTITNAKTLAATNTLTLSGTDSTTMTFPTTSATIARTDAANTFTGASTASAWVLTSPTITTKLNPTSDDGAPLGDTTHNWSDLFLASGAVVNYANGNAVLTHTSGILTLGTGTLKITTPTNTTTSVVTIDGTQTLTNKRKQPRVYTATNNASLTPEIDTYDIFHLTAMSAATTINNHSTSTPADGELMEIRFLDNATPRALTWGTNYVAKAGVALPTTTTTSKNLSVLFEWNANLSKWNLMASGLEA